MVPLLCNLVKYKLAALRSSSVRYLLFSSTNPRLGQVKLERLPSCLFCLPMLHRHFVALFYAVCKYENRSSMNKRRNLHHLSWGMMIIYFSGKKDGQGQRVRCDVSSLFLIANNQEFSISQYWQDNSRKEQASLKY